MASDFQGVFLIFHSDGLYFFIG